MVDVSVTLGWCLLYVAGVAAEAQVESVGDHTKKHTHVHIGHQKRKHTTSHALGQKKRHVYTHAVVQAMIICSI